MSKIEKTIIIESLIASPPTSKCQETIQVLEELVRNHPDELRLVVFRRGIDIYPEEASNGMKVLMQKGAPVPAVIVNGSIFITCKVPKLEDLEAEVKQVFKYYEENPG
jgi:hypothetical protein